MVCVHDYNILCKMSYSLFSEVLFVLLMDQFDWLPNTSCLYVGVFKSSPEARTHIEDRCDMLSVICSRIHNNYDKKYFSVFTRPDTVLR